MQGLKELKVVGLELSACFPLLSWEQFATSKHTSVPVASNRTALSYLNFVMTLLCMIFCYFLF